MKHCPRPDCPHCLAHGIAADFRDDIEVCTDCGSPLVPGPAPEPARDAADATTAKMISRLAVSAGAVAVSLLGTQIRLPGLDPGVVDRVAASGGLAQLSVLALGLAPFLSATIVVEFAALVVPPWRCLRRGTPEQRSKLFRASLVLTVVLALIQGFAVTQYVGGLGGAATWTAQAWMLLTLVAGSVLLLGLAGAVHRFGAGNGISVLLAGAFVPHAIDAVRTVARALSSHEISPFHAMTGAAVLVLVAYGTWRLARASTPPAPCRMPILRLPASGVLPILYYPSVIYLPRLVGLAGLEDVSPQGELELVVLEVVVVVALCVALSLLFHLPKNVARVWKRSATSAELVRGVAASCLFLAGLVVASSLEARALPPGGAVGVLAVVVCTAVALDVVAELRFRARTGEIETVWPVHQVYGAQAAMSALRDEGIAFCVRGLNHRTLLQFLGPYVSAEIVVPADQADRARKLLHAILVESRTDGTTTG